MRDRERENKERVLEGKEIVRDRKRELWKVF